MNALQKTLCAAGLALVVGLGFSTVYRAGPHTVAGKPWGSKEHRTDFTVYQEAGRAILDRTDIYEAHNRRGWYYMYLPVFAIAMAPLALTTAFWASLVWYALSVAMFAHTVVLSGRLARRVFPDTKVPEFWLRALTVVLLLRPAMSGIARGQASLLVTYLVVLAVWLYVERREWFAAFCLAGAIVLKIFPALLGLYFLAKRRWLMCAATGLWLIVLVWIAPSLVFGVAGNLALLKRWATTIALPANTPDAAGTNVRYTQMIDPRIDRNQSVQAVMIRTLAGSRKDAPVPQREPLARRVALAINVLLLAITAWCCRKQGNEITQLGAVTLLMLFCSPVSWNHNYTLLALPVTVALAAPATLKPMRGALVAYLGLSLVSLAVQALYVYGALLWGALSLWAAFAWYLNENRDSRRHV